MIVLAVEINNYVHAYDHNKNVVLNVQGHLHGYSQSYIAVKHLNDENIDIYNAQGELAYKYPHDFIDMSNIAGIIL